MITSNSNLTNTVTLNSIRPRKQATDNIWSELPCIETNETVKLAFGQADMLKPVQEGKEQVDSKLALNSFVFDGYVFKIRTDISQHIVNKTDVDIEGEVKKLTDDRIYKDLSVYLINGTQANKSFDGLATVLPTTNDVACTTIGVNEIEKLISSLDSMYIDNACFVMNKVELNKFTGLRDKNNELCVKVIGGKKYLLGYPVYINEGVTDKRKVYFGDLQSAIQLTQSDIVDEQPQKDTNSFMKGSKTYIRTVVADMKVLDTNAIKVLKTN